MPLEMLPLLLVMVVMAASSSFAQDTSFIPLSDRQTMMDLILRKQNSLGTNTSQTYLRGDLVWAIPSTSVPTMNFVTRAIGTAFQTSATAWQWVRYSIPVTCAAPLIAGQSTTTVFQYADNQAMNTNLKNVESVTNSASGVLGLSNAGPGNVGGVVPANKWYRLTSTGNCSVTNPAVGTEALF